jgi:hypothetical protein
VYVKFPLVAVLLSPLLAVAVLADEPTVVLVSDVVAVPDSLVVPELVLVPEVVLVSDAEDVLDADVVPEPESVDGSAAAKPLPKPRAAKPRDDIPPRPWRHQL